MKTSKGEEKIIRLLKKAKIPFEREKRFTDLKKGQYRFDFYIRGARPCLIEFNGEQHYQYVPRFHKTRSDFLSGQERDRRKISYCLAHHIPLYVIPYWKIDEINTAKDLFDDQFRADNRWKNDFDWMRR